MAVNPFPSFFIAHTLDYILIITEQTHLFGQGTIPLSFVKNWSYRRFYVFSSLLVTCLEMPTKGSCSFPSVWSAIEGLPRTFPTYIFGFLWPACLGHRVANSDQVSWRFTRAEQCLKNHIAGILKTALRYYYGQYAGWMIQRGFSVGEGGREVKLNVRTDYSHLYALTQSSLSFRTISAEMVKEDELIKRILF